MVIESDQSDDDEKDIFEFFVEKVLPNALPSDEVRRKILSKQSIEESQIQLNILDKANEINEILKTRKPKDLFCDETCNLMYNKLIELQTTQNFSGSGWKVICHASLVPMVHRIFIFTSCVFHTRKCSKYLSTAKFAKVMSGIHPDIKLTGEVSDLVEQQKPSSLDEKPTRKIISGNDWPIEENLENLDKSGSSVDSGRTIIKPHLPVMDAVGDISRINFDDTTMTDSYLDVSFLTPKRRLNLSKKQKIDILETPKPSSSPDSNHSTPVRRRSHSLGTIMKRTQPDSLARAVRRPHQANRQPSRNFMTDFLQRWFRNQMSDITQELQDELNRMN